MNKKSRLILIFTLIGVIVILILVSGFALSQTMHQIMSDIILKGLAFFKNLQEPVVTISSTSWVTKKATTTTSTVTTTINSISTTTIPELESESITCSSVASGAQTYNGSTKNNPRITQVFVNPLDVKKFARQIVNVNIQELNKKQITKVSGVASTDNNSVNFSLSLISGTSINGTWQGSWLNQDSYCRNYTLSIIAKSESGQSNIVLTFK